MSDLDKPKHAAYGHEERAQSVIEYEGAQIITAPFFARTLHSLSINPERYVFAGTVDLPGQLEQTVMGVDTTNGGLEISAQITVRTGDNPLETGIAINKSIAQVDEETLQSYGLSKAFGFHSDYMVFETDGGVKIGVYAEYPSADSLCLFLKTNICEDDMPLEAPFVDHVDCAKAVGEFSALWLITLREIEKAVNSDGAEQSQLAIEMTPQQYGTGPDYEMDEQETKGELMVYDGPLDEPDDTARDDDNENEDTDRDVITERTTNEYLKNDISFSDIGGNNRAKKELLDLAQSLKHPEVLEKWGVRRPSGVLLYGPPGTGKTSLVKAFAHEIEATVWAISADQIMGKWLGESEANIREIFETADEITSPTIMFFDEIDAIIQDPENANSGAERVRRNVAGIFKQELEKLAISNPNIIIVATTNHLDDISPAMKRSGRFDKHIHVPLPDEEDRVEIFSIKIAGSIERLSTETFWPFDDDIDTRELARETEERSGADITSIFDGLLYKKAMEESRTGYSEPINQKDMLQAIRDKRQQ